MTWQDVPEEWAERCQEVYAEIDRCIIHMETGLFSSHRADPIHARIIQLLTKRITLTDTPSLALALGHTGFSILINPEYFLTTLRTTAERSSALRHIEQHLFLSHPDRQYRYSTSHEEQGVAFQFDIYQAAAEIEADSFISGQECLRHQFTAALVPDLEIASMASAETLYRQFLSLEAEKLQYLLACRSHQSPCDQQHWMGEKQYSPEGDLVHIQQVSIHNWALLRKERDRIILRARELLSPNEIKQLPREIHAQLDDILLEYNLHRYDPDLAEQAERELGATVVQMMLQDPFFGQFISGCVRQITDTIETAGVTVLQNYLVLLINPHFFLNELNSRAERAAVLKHEALHIMLKHVLQIQDDKFPNQKLYNIASDLEVNQYIGAPWSLPDGAILLSTFPDFDLPQNDVAERYYEILEKELKKCGGISNSTALNDSQRHLQDAVQSHSPSGGHSDHRGWQGKEGRERPALHTGVHSAINKTTEGHSLEIERQMKRAMEGLSSHQFGKIDRYFIRLLEEWATVRRSVLDWRKELRLFLSSAPSTSSVHTHRRKNNRYHRLSRRALQATSLSVDAINLLARTAPEHLPQLYWKDVPQNIKDEVDGALVKHLDTQGDARVDWATVPYRVVWILQKQLPKLKWPDWSVLSDKQLRQISVFRIPLDPKRLPEDIVVLVARNCSYLLPRIEWSIFTKTKERELKRQYPHLMPLEFPVWSLLPSEEIAELYRTNPSLFAKLSWETLPGSVLGQLSDVHIGPQPFRIVRRLATPLLGLQKSKDTATILVVIDTSGSVSDRDITYLFAEIDEMKRLGVHLFVLQADTQPRLFFRYVGEKPVAGRGGTAFNPTLRWINRLRAEGVEILVKHPGIPPREEKIQKHFDGVLYLTDGQASVPMEKTYCRLLWVLTPDGSEESIQKSPHPATIIRLPKYQDRQ